MAADGDPLSLSAEKDVPLRERSTWRRAGTAGLCHGPVMVTSYALTKAVVAAGELEARGFLGTVGKIAAWTIVFFVAIGFIVGLILGIFIGRATRRRT